MKIYLQKELKWESINFQTIQFCFDIWFVFESLICKLEFIHTTDPWTAIYKVKWKNLKRRYV